MTYAMPWGNPYLPQYNQGQPVQPMLQAYQQQTSGVIKVNGRDSALQYSMPPNSTSPALFDSNGKVFYIVTTDGTGSKSIETFDFLPHVDEPQAKPDFVSRSEFQDLVDKVNNLIGVTNGVHGPVQSATAEQ